MNGTGRRILIVEDQRLIAADLENTLVKLGYLVAGIAATGEGAIEQTRDRDPELVLMNIRLRGEMDGIEAAAIIGERFGVPVVYLTAYADEETISRAKETTPFGYVVKPFNERELRAAIEVALYKEATERMLAEERARARAAEEFKFLVENLRDHAIFRLDSTGRIASWNMGAARFFGHRGDEVAGRPFAFLFSPIEVADETPKALLERAEREGRADVEGWKSRRDGTRHWAGILVTALRVSADRPRGYVVMARDLSERRGYEAALRESEERFRTAVIHAPVPMMLHAEDGEVLAVSEAVVEATGYRREQLCTLDDWLERAYGERASEIERLVERAFRDGAPPPFELPVRVASGDTRQWLFSLSEPLILGGGRRGLVAVAVDVTSQRRAEEDLLASHRQKDEFIAMLGHELRNPLAAVRSATDLLRLRARDDPKYQHIHAVLARQTAQMAKLIDGLLDVSRIVSGRIVIERDAVDLSAIVREAIEDRTAHIEERGHDLRVDIASEPLWVSGDRVRLAQVIDNLLANAIRFTESPGHITVTAKREGDQILVIVRDTGGGISADLLPHIFEPFRQADKGLGRAAGGLGLGLAVVKGVVELHGGSVTVASQPGSGAEFSVRLPLAEPPPRHTEKAQLSGWPARVLIVEDNEDAADTLRTVLETLGNEVAVAYDGASALTAAAAFKPDVVLCDIGLPGAMSGYDVARALRDDTVLLVAVTGYGRPEDIQRADEAGFDAHLTKPIDVLLIEDLLRERRAATAHTKASAGP